MNTNERKSNKFVLSNKSKCKTIVIENGLQNIKESNFLNQKNIPGRLIISFLMMLISLLFLSPIIITFANSFMREGEIFYNYSALLSEQLTGDTGSSLYDFINIKLIPDMVVIRQYYNIFLDKVDYLFYFWNSVKIVIPIIAGQVLISAAAAYAFAKLEFKFKEQLFFIYIITMMMPYQVTLVPNYIIIDQIGLVGTVYSIILPGIFTPFGVFLLRQFISFIPEEYIEAALVDGASRLKIFKDIVLPIIKPGIISLIILTFIDNWNMVEQPLIFLRELNQYPLSVILKDVIKDELGIAFAASTLYMAPALLLFLYGEDYLIEGIHLSGIKG